MHRYWVLSGPVVQQAVDRQAGRAGLFRCDRVPGFVPDLPAQLGLRQIGQHHAVCGGQQAYNRYLIGGASGAEYAALKARQFFGVQQMPVRQGMGQTGQASGTGSSGAGSRMLAQLARLARLGRR